MFTSPFSTAFVLGGYEIKMYGVVMFFAIICAILTVNFIAKKYYREVDIDILTDFYPILIISGIICARAYYVILNIDYYILKPSEIIALWHGGISIHGAILGGVIAGILYFKKKKLSILKYADVITYGLVMGQIIGRWGNFFNSEAFGTPCNLPWKLYIAPSYRPIEYYSYSYFHPTFLYESLFCILIFLILFFGVRKVQKERDGLIFYSYFILYSIGRFIIEGIRTDSVLNIGTVPIAQIASVLLFITGAIGCIWAINKSKKLPPV